MSVCYAENKLKKKVYWNMHNNYISTTKELRFNEKWQKTKTHAFKRTLYLDCGRQ